MRRAVLSRPSWLCSSDSRCDSTFPPHNFDQRRSLSVIIAILGLSVLIVVHEFGHYLVARLVGMRTKKFSIGFGPAILRVQGKETIFQVAAIPFGGYVQIAGMGGGGEGDELDQLWGDRQPERDYNARPLWQRASVVAAGPIFNFVFAIVVYAFLFQTSDAVAFQWKREATVVVHKVTGPAELAGLRVHDTIERIDGEPIRTFAQLKRVTGAAKGEAMTVVVARGPQGEMPPSRAIETQFEGLVLLWPEAPDHWPRLTFTVTPEKTDQGYRLGIVPEVARFGSTDFAASVRLASAECYSVTVGIFRLIGRWMTGEEEAQLASVVKITEIGADTVEMGAEWFLGLLAILSINLGLLNLLPLPALDGGRLAFIAVEVVARRPVPRKIETLVHGVGMLFLLALMVWVVAGEIAEKF